MTTSQGACANLFVIVKVKAQMKISQSNLDLLVSSRPSCHFEEVAYLKLPINIVSFKSCIPIIETPGLFQLAFAGKISEIPFYEMEFLSPWSLDAKELL